MAPSVRHHANQLLVRLRSACRSSWSTLRRAPNFAGTRGLPTDDARLDCGQRPHVALYPDLRMVAILEHMSALSDSTRCRVLMLLEKQELTVTDPVSYT